MNRLTGEVREQTQQLLSAHRCAAAWLTLIPGPSITTGSERFIVDNSDADFPNGIG